MLNAEELLISGYMGSGQQTHMFVTRPDQPSPATISPTHDCLFLLFGPFQLVVGRDKLVTSLLCLPGGVYGLCFSLTKALILTLRS